MFALLLLSSALAAVEVKDLIHGDVYVETQYERMMFGRFGQTGVETRYDVDLSPLCGSEVPAECNMTHVKTWSLFVEFEPKGSVLSFHCLQTMWLKLLKFLLFFLSHDVSSSG